MQGTHSWIDWLASLSETKRAAIVKKLSPEDVKLILTDWRFTARPEQLPPPGNWRTWLILAGRGWGKTATSCQFIINEIREGRAKNVALCGRSSADCRDIIVEGPSGILASSPDDFRPIYEPSKRRLTWPNGAIATCLSAEKPDQFRGFNSDLAYADELAAWQRWDAWDQLQFGLRIGDNPRVVVATTPRPLARLKRLAELPNTVVTRGRTTDNMHNLAQSFIDAIYERYANSTLGRQELEGELLTELPGALFLRKDIEAHRVDKAPELTRIVVAIDPATTSNENSDESGIVVVGVSRGHFYVLADLSIKATPEKLCRRAIEAYEEYQADAIVVEANQGGDTWKTIINGIKPSVNAKSVHASRSKTARAEPVAARFEQGKAHIVGSPLVALEDQLCNYVPGLTRESPDRLDALVWAITELDGATLPNLKIDVDSGYRGANLWI